MVEAAPREAGGQVRLAPDAGTRSVGAATSTWRKCGHSRTTHKQCRTCWRIQRRRRRADKIARGICREEGCFAELWTGTRCINHARADRKYWNEKGFATRAARELREIGAV